MKEAELITLFTRGIEQVAPEKAGMVSEIGLDGKLSDLALDSIAIMELVSFVEEQIGRRFHDDDLAQLSTFQQLADLIRTESTT